MLDLRLKTALVSMDVAQGVPGQSLAFDTSDADDCAEFVSWRFQGNQINSSHIVIETDRGTALYRHDCDVDGATFKHLLGPVVHEDNFAFLDHEISAVDFGYFAQAPRYKAAQS